ncbi:MAG: hypothetical protein WAN61_04275 [Minisyncoccia bacterium]
MLKTVRIFLLVLIIIGLIALFTQKIWVPKLVNEILLSENYSPKIIPAQTVLDPTAGWKTETNMQFGFSFRYPDGFFDANQMPKILAGNCNYGVFPDSCPNINNIVIADQVAGGGDINAIESNFSYPNYWKNSKGEKLTINNIPYCLYQTTDAAMMHVYNYYYYATVADKQCLVVNFNTSSTNCEAYLPLQNGNPEQKTNYENCLASNTSQPNILNQILSTFKFTKM